MRAVVERTAAAVMVHTSFGRRGPAGAGTAIAMVTSPAGVRVEINQGLEAR